MAMRRAAVSVAAARSMSAVSASGPMRRDTPFLGVDDRRFSGLAELDFVPLVARKIEMGRAWRVRQGRAPRMPHQPRQFGGLVDRGREFRHRGEERCVGNFLVGIAMLKRRRLAAGQRNHRAAPQKGVLESRGQVGGANRLRHAHARPPDNPGVAIGHISRGLFRMRQDRGHSQVLQLQQRAAEHQLHKKDMRRTRPGQRPGQPLCAVHRSVLTQFRFPPGIAPRRPGESGGPEPRVEA